MKKTGYKKKSVVDKEQMFSESDIDEEPALPKRPAKKAATKLSRPVPTKKSKPVQPVEEGSSFEEDSDNEEEAASAKKSAAKRASSKAVKISKVMSEEEDSSEEEEEEEMEESFLEEEESSEVCESW